MPPTSPVLNYDVLLQVMAHASVQDCARLMRTSRFLYAHGPRHILQSAPVIKSDLSLRSLLAFLFAQPNERFELIRGLKLLFSDLSSSASLELAKALPRMVNLQSLAVHGTLIDITLPTVFAESFAGFPLRELEISQADAHSLNALSGLRCGLKRLAVVCLTSDDRFSSGLFAENVWPDYHPVRHLQNLASTLEELDITYWCTHPTIAPSPDIIYPRMRTLHLREATVPLTFPLINAYPNLENLSFAMRLTQYFFQGTTAARTRNISQQQQALRTWERLREFTGTLDDLYALGLMCQIDRVALRPGLALCPRSMSGMFNAVIPHACPRQLELGEWCVDIQGPRGDGKFDVFRGPGGSRLEMFTVEGRLEGGHGDVVVSDVLDDLVDALQHTPLRHFVLNIYTEHIDPTSFPSDTRPLGVAEKSAQDLDLEAYLRRLAAAVPTLQTAVLSVQGPRDALKTRKATWTDGGIEHSEIRGTPWWAVRRPLRLTVEEEEDLRL